MKWVLSILLLILTGCGTSTWRIHGKVEGKLRAEYDIEKGRAAVKERDTHTESLEQE